VQSVLRHLIMLNDVTLYIPSIHSHVSHAYRISSIYAVVTCNWHRYSAFCLFDTLALVNGPITHTKQPANILFWEEDDVHNFFCSLGFRGYEAQIKGVYMVSPKLMIMHFLFGRNTVR
jgi:hypothetical protein